MEEKKTNDLCKNGSKVHLVANNLGEFMEVYLIYSMLNSTRQQIMINLLGFYDVIPVSLMTICDFNELKLLMCGQPKIDMEYWKENTEYSEEFEFFSKIMNLA